MNKYNVTFIKDDVTSTKIVEAQDEGTVIAVMLRDEKVSNDGILKIELVEDKENIETSPVEETEVESIEPEKEIDTPIIPEDDVSVEATIE